MGDTGDPGEEGEPGYLDREKENDPMEIQKEALRLQKEGLQLFKGQLAAARAPGGVGVGVRAFEPPPPTSVTFQVRKIENGFILAKQMGGLYQPGVARETYCETVEGVLGTAAALIRDFYDPVTAPEPGFEAPEGT